MRILFTVVALGLSCLWAMPTHACSIAVSEHVIDPSLAAEDTTPPSVPTLGAATWTGRVDGSSCSDLRFLRVEVAASDDLSGPDALGYEVALVPAPDWAYRYGALRATGGQVTWVMPEVDPGRLSVRVRAVDEAGNYSEYSEPVPVDEHVTYGCASASGAAGAPTLALLAGLVLLLGLRERSVAGS